MPFTCLGSSGHWIKTWLWGQQVQRNEAFRVLLGRVRTQSCRCGLWMQKVRHLTHLPSLLHQLTAACAADFVNCKSWKKPFQCFQCMGYLSHYSYPSWSFSWSFSLIIRATRAFSFEFTQELAQHLRRLGFSTSWDLALWHCGTVALYISLAAPEVRGGRGFLTEFVPARRCRRN